MPVTAEQPELKERRIKNKPNGSTAFTRGGRIGGKPMAKDQVLQARPHQQHQGKQHLPLQQPGPKRREDLGAQVGAIHHIDPSPLGIGRDCLALGGHHNRDQGGDRDRDWQRKREGSAASQNPHPEGRIGWHRPPTTTHPGQPGQRPSDRQALRIGLDQLGQILQEGRRLGPIDDAVIGGEVYLHLPLDTD